MIKKIFISFKKPITWHCRVIQKFYDQPSIEKENMSTTDVGLRENDLMRNIFKGQKKL